MALKQRTGGMETIQQSVEHGLLYTILDACDVPAIPERARTVGETSAVSLYKGQAEQELWAIAPYLFKMDTDLVSWLKEELLGVPWGVLVISKTDLETLRSHFRKFTIVREPGGDAYYFRFYDPRVLPTYLESSTPEQLQEFFGPVLFYGVWSGGVDVQWFYQGST